MDDVALRIGVIGGGVVGYATAHAFEGWRCNGFLFEEVRVHDIKPGRGTHQLEDALDCNLVFVCLPTPQKDNELACDLSVLEEFFKWVGNHAHWRNGNYVLRSTVPVGATRRLREEHGLPNLVHSPEFLTERTALFDSQMPARCIVGDVEELRARDELSRCASLLRNMYGARFPGASHWMMTSEESEMVKLMQNSFSAVKIGFFNEMEAMARKRKLDWSIMMRALLAGGWISSMHTQVPGPDGKRGFGGSCLPKDLANMVQCLRDSGDCLDWVTYAALQRNKKDRVR